MGNLTVDHIGKLHPTWNLEHLSGRGSGEYRREILVDGGTSSKAQPNLCTPSIASIRGKWLLHEYVPLLVSVYYSFQRCLYSSVLHIACILPALNRTALFSSLVLL